MFYIILGILFIVVMVIAIFWKGNSKRLDLWLVLSNMVGGLVAFVLLSLFIIGIWVAADNPEQTIVNPVEIKTDLTEQNEDYILIRGEDQVQYYLVTAKGIQKIGPNVVVTNSVEQTYAEHILYVYESNFRSPFERTRDVYRIIVPITR